MGTCFIEVCCLACSGGGQWQEKMVDVSGDMIARAVQWVQEMNSFALPAATPTPHMGLGDVVQQILCQEEVPRERERERERERD